MHLRLQERYRTLFRVRGIPLRTDKARSYLIRLLPVHFGKSVETGNASSLQSNLTTDLVAKAAKAMRIPPRSHSTGLSGLIKGGCPKDKGDILETIFKSDAGEITLNCEFKEEKRHNWLEIK
jgi:hypothetical protein